MDIVDWRKKIDELDRKLVELLSERAQAAHEIGKLKKDATPLGRARLKYFWQNKGPWSDLDGHDAFLPNVPERKPLGANFYPADMTKPEFEQKSARIKQIYADFLVELDALKARRSKLVTGFTNKLQGSRVEQIRKQIGNIKP